MIPLQRVSPAEIAQAWPGGEKYRIDGDLVRQNLIEHPLLHPSASLWKDSGFVAIKRSAAPLYAGPDPKIAHLALFAGASDALLDHAINVLRDEGVEALVVGTDSGHFIPGVPTDLPELTVWLESRGFVAGGVAYDLERDVQNCPRPPEVEGVHFRSLAESDLPSLESFLRREFPGRWTYDVRTKIAVEGTGTVFGMFVEENCEGFALLQRQSARMPIGGAVWRASLGQDWGSLGPIGISKAMRGQGLGDALLAHSLADLSRKGTRQTIIDWTTLTEFYGKHGFAVTRSYRAYRLAL